MNTGEMARRIVVAAALIGMLATPLPAASQPPPEESQVQKELESLAWQRGPSQAQIDSVAAIQVPEGQAFLDGPNTRRFLELNGNPPRDKHYTLVSAEFSWFAVFSFENSGYVKDDEKLDADALLASLQASDTPSNKERLLAAGSAELTSNLLDRVESRTAELIEESGPDDSDGQPLRAYLAAVKAAR